MAVSSASESAEQKVRKYMSALSPDGRRTMRKMRDTILSAAPMAEEAFSYGMPGFRLDGRVLVWYAAWKNHFSLYPITAAIQRANAAAMKGYETSKGTVQFPATKSLPVTLIRRLVRARAGEVRRAATLRSMHQGRRSRL
jgi:uncharacterized protein YdhG (YjbR/CyaY superfamily)